MGGRSGSSVLTSRERRKLKEQRARKILKDGDGGRKHNVFISFASEDLAEVNMLRGQAKNENSTLEFNDRSLKKPFDSENEDYIKRGIRERIRYCSVTIVYVSDETPSSKWVDWEIRESLAMGKGVLAMYKGETKPRHLPKAIVQNNIKVLPWKQQLINDAIQEHAENRQD